MVTFRLREGVFALEMIETEAGRRKAAAVPSGRYDEEEMAAAPNTGKALPRHGGGQAVRAATA